MSKLSDAQKRALKKLSSDWKTHYDLKETLPTLRKLVLLGYAEEKPRKRYFDAKMFRLVTVKVTNGVPS